MMVVERKETTHSKYISWLSAFSDHDRVSNNESERYTSLHFSNYRGRFVENGHKTKNTSPHRVPNMKIWICLIAFNRSGPVGVCQIKLVKQCDRLAYTIWVGFLNEWDQEKQKKQAQHDMLSYVPRNCWSWPGRVEALAINAKMSANSLPKTLGPQNLNTTKDLVPSTGSATRTKWRESEVSSWRSVEKWIQYWLQLPLC